MEKWTDNRSLSREDLRATLQHHGVLPTRQRLAIAEVLLARPQHLSAEQILERVNAKGPLVAKATIYNTLNLFARRGLIREVIVDPTKVFYDPSTFNHHHFYNLDTGELTDIDGDAFTITDVPPTPDGTVADGVDVIIRVRNA